MLNYSVEAGANVVSIELLNVTSSKTRVTITDNGTGIDSSIKKIIGKQGFTSKKNGKGLGLSHAIKSIGAWGGSLNIVSNCFKSEVDSASTGPTSMLYHCRL